MPAFQVRIAARPLGLAVWLTLGGVAAAQQAIQFSKPANQDSAAAATSSVQTTHPAPAAFNASSSLLGNGGASFDVLPSGPQAIPLGNPAQWKKFLDNRKNWALETPNEILNVPTPESILGIADPQDDAQLSAEQRYFRRQERQSRMDATNALSHSDLLLERDRKDNEGPFRDMDDDGRRLGEMLNGASPVAGALRDLKQLDVHGVRSLADVNQADATWSSPFGVRVEPVKQTPEQLQGMDSFRALLDGAPPTVEKPAGSAFFDHAAVRDPNLQAEPAGYNPIGHSYTPVADSIARPVGLTPLPDVTGSHAAPAKKGSSVQPPPWLSSTPSAANPVFPQRQF